MKGQAGLIVIGIILAGLLIGLLAGGDTNVSVVTNNITTLPASNISSGTFQSGDFVFQNNLGVGGFLNLTGTNITIYFSNGCNQITNATGWYIVC